MPIIENTITREGITYRASAPLFPDSINKCTGCAFHAIKHKSGCAGNNCHGTLRPDFRNVIYIKVQGLKP